MKNNNIIILIAGLFLIIILLVFKNINGTIVNCCSEKVEPNTCNHRSEIPNYDNLVKTMLYYKVDDHCNFQTLVFQSCFDEEAGAENNNAYSILGRFNGKKLSDSQYLVNSLELKHFFLNTNNKPDYHIGGVSVLPESNSSHIKIAFQLVKGKTDKNKLDYIYGVQANEQPITIDRDANIDFFVIDSESGILKSMGCTDISPISGAYLSGGYECNGKAAW